jgi:hypothetical protein
MIVVNSLSGGKTSSYLAYHYPADYNIFSLVRIEDMNCRPNDNKLIQMVSDKIGTEFIATAESDITLKVMFDLEQLLGKEIIWVTGLTFEQLIKKKSNYLPNRDQRFCTIELKMRPIFDWWYKNIREKVLMQIGYRHDEEERKINFSEEFKGIVGKRNTKNRWETINWRVGSFPLIDDKVNHYTVYKWAKTTELLFPPDSNCVGCFHKNPQQLRKNFDDENKKMNWFKNQESNKGTWKKGWRYSDIENIGLQLDFNFGTGSGCQAGFCTN